MTPVVDPDPSANAGLHEELVELLVWFDQDDVAELTFGEQADKVIALVRHHAREFASLHPGEVAEALGWEQVGWAYESVRTETHFPVAFTAERTIAHPERCRRVFAPPASQKEDAG